MIELRKEFTKRGTSFKQLYKDNGIAIYRISRPNADNTKESVWYEVFHIRTHKADKFHNDVYERYPSDESFGSWAWSCSNIDSIRKVLNKHFANHNGNTPNSLWCIDLESICVCEVDKL